VSVAGTFLKNRWSHLAQRNFGFLRQIFSNLERCRRVKSPLPQRGHRILVALLISAVLRVELQWRLRDFAGAASFRAQAPGGFRQRGAIPGGLQVTVQHCVE
jgi:hypothetical protein